MKKLLSLTLLSALLSLTGCFKYECGYETSLCCRIDKILSEYKEDAIEFKNQSISTEEEASALDLVADSAHNWWDVEIRDPLNDDIPSNPKSLDNLLVSAIKNSTQIKVFSEVPLIRETDVQIANSTFDPVAFLEARFDRTNRPVGTTLETDSDPQGDRLKEVDFTFEGGLRKRFVTGADAELRQIVGRKDSNSSFFEPNPQGDAELKLTINQPLLKGAGVAYNTTAICIAKIDNQVAQMEFLRQAESHLLEVTRSYWNVYQARAIYYQKDRLVKRTQAVLSELESRSGLDARSSQIIRARASLSQRKSDLIRAEVAIRNAQDRLKTLISDPEMSIYSEQEIIPTDAPFQATVPNVNIVEAAGTALKERPEVNQAFKELNSALLREKVAKNDLLPTLNMFLEGRLSGLSGNEPYYGNAWNNQYTKGSPGYSGGLAFEYPLGNNAAEAAHRRTKLEIRQQMSQILTTVETVLLEVKVAVRELEASYKEVVAKHEAMVAAREDLTSMTARRSVEVGSDMETTSYLEFLLESQERLSIAEEEFVRSLIVHNVAFFNLQRAQGTLLSYNDMHSQMTCVMDPCDCQYMPVMSIEK